MVFVFWCIDGFVVDSVVFVDDDGVYCGMSLFFDWGYICIGYFGNVLLIFIGGCCYVGFVWVLEECGFIVDW